ncbi:MAG: hypothetical protein AAF560_03775 [Acidobacteriota bacterium]
MILWQRLEARPDLVLMVFADRGALWIRTRMGLCGVVGVSFVDRLMVLVVPSSVASGLPNDARRGHPQVGRIEPSSGSVGVIPLFLQAQKSLLKQVLTHLRQVWPTVGCNHLAQHVVELRLLEAPSLAMLPGFA